MDQQLLWIYPYRLQSQAKCKLHYLDEISALASLQADSCESRLALVVYLGGSHLWILEDLYCRLIKKWDPDCGSFKFMNPSGRSGWIRWWILLLDPNGSKWWVLVDTTCGSWWIIVLDHCGPQWWILVDPSGGSWWMHVVDPHDGT